MNDTRRFRVTRVLRMVVLVFLVLYTVSAALELLGNIVLIADPHHQVGRLYSITSLLEFHPEGGSSPYREAIRSRTFTGHMDLMAYFTIRPTSRVAFLFLFFYGVAYSGLYFMVFYQLYRIFSSIEEGDPFVRNNIRRLRLLGGGLLGAEFLRLGLSLAWSLRLLDMVSVSGGRLSYLGFFWYWEWLNPGLLLTGFSILGIAEVFREGVILREEQQLTI